MTIETNSQNNRLKSGKKWYEETLKLSSNVLGDSNHENHFPDNSLLTNTQVSKTRKLFS